MFVYPTKPGTVRVGETQYAYPHTPEVMTSVRYELILLYICKLQSLLIHSLVDFFTKVNPSADFNRYISQEKELETATKDLWFVYDTPTSFDKNESDNIKNWARSFGHEVDKSAIIYYRNPLERLLKLRISEKKIRPYSFQ